ncbi:PAS/PAC sensor-containing diguanylate cyclase/phosphodiesterase [Salinisphaera dokdonensis CL-ES53]|uniref:PAS/PAC sensor-containing diguanylate cyclase/phosphodiesterase n=1 Tax=Salinisphaera dokdonensis CL-ES53 TaxID=1304272 RepID=A0ABV2B375_9GAMM
MHQVGIEVLERHARGGIWWFDTETGVIYWSDGIYKQHGLKREDYTPDLESALAFYTEESRARLEAALARATEEGSGYSLTVEICRADGSQRFAQAIGQVEERPGKPPLLAGALLDVHDQVVAQNESAERERQLLEETTRWRIASENAGLGLIDIDMDRDIYRIYGRFGSSVGLSEGDEVALERAQWLTWIHEHDRAQRKRRIDAHLAGNSLDYVSEYRLKVPGRDEIWVKEAGQQLDQKNDRRIVGTLSDITARKRSEAALNQSQRRLRETMSHAPTGIALVSPEGRWLSVNRALCEIVGYDEMELLRTTFQDITHPDDLETDLAYVHDLLEGRRLDYMMEKRYFHKQGHIVDIQLDVSLLRDEQGEPLYFISHIQDISERKRAHRQLFEAKELAEVTFEAIGEGVVRVDANEVVSELNSAAAQLLGLPRSSIVGNKFGDVIRFFDAEEDRQLPDPLSGVLTAGDRVRVPIFTRLQRADGDFISIVDSISPIHDDTGAIQGAVFVFQDISEARRMTDELVHQASHDALTGLPNRRGFQEALDRTWARVKQGALNAFVMYLDLDHFKTVNDTGGHSAGDELLRQIGLRLRALLRGSDVLSRLGGDEFAAIVHTEDLEGACIVADKIVAEISDLDFAHGERRYAVGVSIGIAALDRRLASTEAALIHADAALYVAKDSGRNRYHAYSDDSEAGAEASRYIDTAELLRSGLEQDRFILYLQAIVDDQGRRLGYEALLRFDGDAGVVGPDAFLPTAKRLGMMGRIDRWVVARAIALIKHYESCGLWPHDCALSINLSPVSIADPKFHTELIALLEQKQANPSQLMFEITESEALYGEHYPQLIQNLRDRGYQVWLDDFASGYNSFDMLKRAAVDGIKIDRSFVGGLEKDPIDRAVVRSIGTVSRALQLGVTAEGVETEAVLELLKRAGIRRFQGYLFHRPEPAKIALGGALGGIASG